MGQLGLWVLLIGIPALAGGGVEYVVCWGSKEEKRRWLWRCIPPGLTVIGALLSPALLKKPAEPIGCGMPYLVFFILVGGCTVGLLVGMLLGWLLYASVHKE